MNVLLTLFFLTPMALEGVGIKVYHQYFLYYYLTIPSLLYFYIFFKSHPIHFPPRLTLFSTLFFALGFISLFFSYDKQTSFEYFLFSISLFLIFIFFYNFKKVGEQFVYLLICLLGLFFIGYSLFPLFPPYLEKQVVLASYASHNHLGDFLGLLLILLITFRIKKNPVVLLVAFFSIFWFFIFSFSRSAYLAFLVTAGLFFIQKYKTIRRPYLYIGTVSLGIILVFITLISSQNITSTSPLFNSQQYLSKTMTLNPRDLFSGRDIFAKQALQSIKEHSFFGIGAGNFLKASLKYNVNNNISDSAHNIFLEVATEQGIPAVLFLLVIVLLILSSTFNHPSSIFYLFLYLLVNFQTDYTYQIYLFLILAIIIAATSYQEKEEMKFPLWLYGSVNVILLGGLVLVITSTLLLKQNNPVQALSLYPLNRQAYIEAIKQDRDKNAPTLIKKGLSIAPYDTGIILAASEYYLKVGEKEKALLLYEKAYGANHLIAFPIMKQIYFLKKELRSPKEAGMFLKEIIKSLQQIYITESFKKEFGEFCIRAQGRLCAQTGWYNKNN